MNAWIQISREEMYRKVWSTPDIRLAKEFGISDVALKKTCKRMGVPNPPRGYWAKLADGQQTAQVPLPPVKDRQLTEVQFNVEANIKRREVRWQKLIPKPKEQPLPMQNPIQLQASDGELHRLAKRAFATLQNGKPQSDGRIRIKVQKLPLILVSAALGDR